MVLPLTTAIVNAFNLGKRIVISYNEKEEGIQQQAYYDNDDTIEQFLNQSSADETMQ